MTGPSGLLKHFPILEWGANYQLEWLRPDFIAGLTAAAVVVPQSMAYATIAGLPVEVGLYTVLVLMVVYAVTGTSRVLMVSVTSAISILTASTLASAVPAGDSAAYLTAAATLALLVGVFLLLSGLLRLGILANLISKPVLTGFKAGVGVVVLVGQIATVLGVSIDKGPLLQTLAALVQSLDMIHWTTFGVALVSFAIMVILPRIRPQIPASLVAVFLAILASALLNLESLGVSVVGDFPSGLPTPKLPDLALVSQLWPGALGIALLSFIESSAAGRSFLRKGEPPIDANQELVALGVANIGSSMFQGYAGGGNTSITAINRNAGAKTQLSSIILAVTVILVLLLLASVIGLLPQATLGALVMVAAGGLINIESFRAIRRIRNTEFIWAMIAFSGVVLFGILEGVLFAVLISIRTLFFQSSFPPVYAMGRKPGTNVFRPISPDHPDDETFPGLLMARTEGHMNFASAPNATAKFLSLIEGMDLRVIAIDCSAVPGLEYTALESLEELEEQFTDRGIELWLADLNPGPLKIVRRSTLGEVMGNERLFFNLEQVVEGYQAREASQYI